MSARRKPPRFPAPTQTSGDAPASEAQYARLEKYRQTVYVNKQVSVWAKKRCQNKTLKYNEALGFFKIYETVLKERADYRQNNPLTRHVPPTRT